MLPNRISSNIVYFANVPKYCKCRIHLQYFYIILVGDLLAVMAFELYLRLGNNLKTGDDLLIVGNAFGIDAFGNAHDFIRDLYHPFFHHFKLADNIQFGTGSHQGYFIDLIIRKKYLGELDDPFFSQFIAAQVVANGDHGIQLIQIQDGNYFKQGWGGHMVNHGAFLNRAD